LPTVTRQQALLLASALVVLLIGGTVVLLDGDPTAVEADPDERAAQEEVTAQPDISPAPLPEPGEPADDAPPGADGGAASDTVTRPTPEAVPRDLSVEGPAVAATPDPRTRDSVAGSSTVEDPVGDVTDTAGGPPTDPEPAVDLTAVTLEGDDTAFTVIWQVAGPVPTSADFLVWSVELWSADELAATITVQQDGARRVAGVLDWSSGAQVVLPDGLEVEDRTLRLEVPLGALPTLQPPLTWQALGQLDGGFEDRAPDAGRAPFPG
jgi:hypothetical protein